MRRVHIYQLPDRLLVCPLSTTDTGLLVASGPHFVIPSDASPEAIGKVALDALAVAGKTIFHPTDWKAFSAVRLQAAGVKSEVAFQRRARLVTVEAENELLTIEPSHNGGTRGDAKGFYGKSETRFHIPRSAPLNDLGASIHAAFLQCTE